MCKEESFHQRQGFELLQSLCRGTPAQRQMAQDAVNRWWWPTLMMLGPRDTDSVHGAAAFRWKIKRFSNDEIRQRFIDNTVPQAELLGLDLPDPELRWNAARSHYDYGEPDWAELARVVAGEGPCNEERMSVRRGAHESGAWVREAAAVHAAKRRVRDEHAA